MCVYIYRNNGHSAQDVGRESPQGFLRRHRKSTVCVCVLEAVCVCTRGSVCVCVYSRQSVLPSVLRHNFNDACLLIASLCLKRTHAHHTHANTHTHTRPHTRTHAHTYTHIRSQTHARTTRKHAQIPMYLREGPYYFVLWNVLAALRHLRTLAI